MKSSGKKKGFPGHTHIGALTAKGPRVSCHIPIHLLTKDQATMPQRLTNGDCRAELR